MAVSILRDELVPQTIMEGEIQSKRFEHLGLGRGVNAKDPKPWLNRSSFQVREVTKDNVMGTDEGGAVQSHDMEIHSSFALQTELQASITAPQTPITIGVDAELSRSVCTWYKAIGEKVLNRTISFRNTFEDSVPFKESQPSIRTAGRVRVENSTFEDRLCGWVLQHIECDDECTREVDQIIKQEKESGKSSAEILLSVLDSEDEASFDWERERETLREDTISETSGNLSAFRNACREFNDTFNITHYVSTIRLGAVRYDTHTVKKMKMQTSTISSFAVANAGGGLAKVKATYHKSSKHLKSTTIGHISDEDTVKRGSSDEAVVEVKLTPITTLIRFPKLRQRFEIELMEYTASSPGGPYYIATFNKEHGSTTNGKPLLLRVHKDDLELHATTDKEKASLFFISSTNNSAHPNEFRITHKPGLHDLERKYKMDPIALYLDTPIRISGRCHGPLKFKKHVEERNSRFMLVSRVSKGSGPVSTAPWKAHRDVFFIKCARRGLTRHSFLAVRKKPAEQQNEDSIEQQIECDWSWESCCVSSMEKEDSDNCSMLFRLLPQRAFSKTKTKTTKLADEKKANEDGEQGRTTDLDKDDKKIGDGWRENDVSCIDHKFKHSDSKE